MLANLIISYLIFGMIFSLGLNLTLWTFNKTPLTNSESIASILLWPTVIVSFLNNYYGYTNSDED